MSPARLFWGSRRLEELHLGATLGSGVVGTVYEGYYRGCEVAVKVAHMRWSEAKGLHSKGYAVDMLDAEVSLYLQLPKSLLGSVLPALVAYGTLVDGVGDRYLFLATQRVGGPLMDALRARQPRVGADVLHRVMLASFAKLQDLHMAKIAHGDVRLDNVTILGEEPWLVDLSHAVAQPSSDDFAKDVGGMVELWTEVFSKCLGLSKEAALGLVQGALHATAVGQSAAAAPARRPVVSTNCCKTRCPTAVPLHSPVPGRPASRRVPLMHFGRASSGRAVGRVGAAMSRPVMG